MTLFAPRSFLLASSCIGLFATPALALDEKDFLAKLNASLQHTDMELLPDTMTVEGDDVSFTDAKLKMGGDQTVSMGPVTMDNIQEVDGGYLVGTISTQSFEISDSKSKSSLKLEPIMIESYHLPAVSDNRTVATTSYSAITTMSGFAVLQGGETLMSSGAIEMTTTIDETSNKMNTQAAMNDVVINLRGKNTNPETVEMLEALKTSTLAGDVQFSGSLALTTGHLDIDMLSFDAPDHGKFDLKFGFTGYTASFMDDLRKFNAMAPKAAAESEDSAAAKTPEQQAAEQKNSTELTLGLIGLAQQLSINNFSLRFEDDSLSERLIAYSAKRSNLEAEQLKNSIKGLVPLMLAQWGLQSLSTSASEAVTAFIDDPKSLTVAAAPAQPLPLPEILSVMSTPEALAKLINLQITAND